MFITNGGLVESTTYGSQDKPAGFNPALTPGSGWDMWNRISAVDPSRATRRSSSTTRI